ncbi:MAG: cell division protein FtsA [Patescibacteria group bacterium]
MARNKIITGLDIGTNSIKALVAEKRGNEWNLLTYSQVPSFGLRRGSVVNIEETSKNIQLLISGIERDCGRRINSVFVNMGGSHLYITPSDGLISVSRADHIISEEDVERVLQATRAINIPMNDEILDVFPKEFVIDDQKGVKHPMGLSGVRLQAKVLLLCYFQQNFVNLTQAILGAKLQIDDIIPSPLAAAEAVLTREQKEIGAALIDIGSATTSLSVFEEGELIHLTIFPLGSASITNDIAIGLKTEIAVAEDIKKQYGTCILPEKSEKNLSVSSQTNKKIEVSKQLNSVSFTKKNLVDIIEPRVSEILDLMQKELKKIGRQELLPGGVVLTGGGAKLSKIRELAKERLGLPCKIGIPKSIVGLDENPLLSTVVGLVMSSPDFYEQGRVIGLNFSSLKNFLSSFKKMLRVFIP